MPSTLASWMRSRSRCPTAARWPSTSRDPTADRSSSCTTRRPDRAASIPIPPPRRRPACGWSRSTAPATAGPIHCRQAPCRRSPPPPRTPPRSSTTSRSRPVSWPAGRPAGASPRPDLVAALFLIGTPAPHEDVPWIPAEHEPAIEAMRADPAHAVELMAGALAAAPAPPDEDGTAALAAGPTDVALLEGDVDLRERVAAMLAEGRRSGPIGVAADIVSYTVAKWGFDPASIGAATTCVYGSADLLVPPE